MPKESFFITEKLKNTESAKIKFRQFNPFLPNI